MDQAVKDVITSHAWAAVVVDETSEKLLDLLTATDILLFVENQTFNI